MNKPTKRDARLPSMPKLSDVGYVPRESGASADGRKVGRSTGRDYKFNTNMSRATHEALKAASVKLSAVSRDNPKGVLVPIGQIIEEACLLWLEANKSRLK